MYNPKLIKGTNHRDIESLHPKLQIMAKAFLILANFKLEGTHEIKIVSALRTWDEQQKLYNQGRTTPGPIVTNAKPGSSIHNWGLAFDVGVFKDGAYNPAGSKAILKNLGPIGEGIGLTWGGRWKSPVDYPHYQYTGTLSNNEFLKQANLGNIAV